MASADFIAVAGDDWYQRRRDDEEGKFWRDVASQGPRKGEGGSTRQGIYFFTAGGKLLGYKNALEAGVMKQEFKKALGAFAKLPEDQRKPGSIRVSPLEKIDTRYSHALPRDALVVRVYTRVLDREK